MKAQQEQLLKQQQEAQLKAQQEQMQKQRQEELLKANRNYKVCEEHKRIIYYTIEKILKCLKIKIICFFVFEFLFMMFFFYYVLAFCHVYNSTQISWLLDSFQTYIIYFLFSLLSSLVISTLYKLAIRNKYKLLYRITILFY